MIISNYIQHIRAYNKDREKTTGRRPGFYIRTYGCQMNVRESENLMGVLLAMGYTRAAREAEADIILYNTCCVRENAEQKILGNLSLSKFYKETNPGLTVVFFGCMAKQPDTLALLTKNYPYVNIILGAGNRHRFPEFLYQYIYTGARVIDTSDAPPEEPDGHTDENIFTVREHVHKAGVNIMYGCDNFCSYCIVPYVRGRERSREPGDILREIQALARDGVKEVMLLGQNVNTYGVNLPKPVTFAGLLRQVNDIPSLSRIRFMTSHPKDFSDDLIGAIRDCAKVCKAVHLPLQSGSTKVLGEMNRRYTREDYVARANELMKEVPGAALTTDIIVGFPGETEEDFQETLDVVRRVHFAGAFTFIYSKRSGTPAAERTDTVPDETAADRFRRLLETVNPIILARNESRLGAVLSVMAEDNKPNKNGTQTGRADDNTLVHFSGREAAPGEIINVRITRAKTFYLLGQAV